LPPGRFAVRVGHDGTGRGNGAAVFSVTLGDRILIVERRRPTKRVQGLRELEILIGAQAFFERFRGVEVSKPGRSRPGAVRPAGSVRFEVRLNLVDQERHLAKRGVLRLPPHMCAVEILLRSLQTAVV